MIIVESRRKRITTLEKLYPEASVIDVTSKGEIPWIRFSPFFPHGNIPIPYSDNATGESVEGIWQGLKVFETEGIDKSKFRIKTMKGIKRSSRKRGLVLGHQKGINSDQLFNYIEARQEIYLPAYRWVLDNFLKKELQTLYSLNEESNVVLLDYETNTDIDNTEKPLSHAGLIKLYIENEWPSL